MTAVPKVGRAAVCHNKATPEYYIELVENYPVPSPKKGELLVKLNVTGLCLSDRGSLSSECAAAVLLKQSTLVLNRSLSGRSLGSYHVSNGCTTNSIEVSEADDCVVLQRVCDCAGHEGSGVVVSLGEEVDPAEWKVGDRVGMKPVIDVCGTCPTCRSGGEQLCHKSVTTGVQVNGSFCEYVTMPARYTTRVPENVSDPVAAVIMCSGVTVYSALKNSRARAGQWVVVPGAGGGVGHQALQYGKVMGLRIIAIDTGDAKRDLCLSLGAEAFIDFRTSPDTVAEVMRLTGEGAHGVVVTGGTAGAYATAPNFLRRGGVQVCVGMPPAGTAMAGADPVLMVYKRLTIVGSAGGCSNDLEEALDMANRGLVKPVIEVLPFSQMKDAWARVVSNQVAGRLVIDYNA